MDLYFAQSGPLEGGGIGDLISNPAISTPAGFALAVLLYIAKVWKDSRSERRADNEQNRTRESHIVDESRDILVIRREEAAEFRKQRQDDRRLIQEQDATIRDLEERNGRLLRNNERLLEDIETLKEIVSDRIGQHIEDRRARDRYGSGRPAERTDPSIANPRQHRSIPGPGEGDGGHRLGAG